MRALAIILILLTACGSKQTGPAGASAAAAATVFPSARFVPARPTYVVSARTMADAQAGFRDIIDVLGMVAGGETAEASAAFKRILGVDPMSAEAVAAIGVDLEGSMVMFSEDVNPTFVVHLDSPEAMSAFFEQQRERGLRTQSVVVAGTEVFTAKIDSDLHISWAVDKDWLWIHFTVGKAEGTEWFEHSKQPTGGTWVDGWKWAQALAASGPALVGIFDLKGMLATAARGAPEILECLKHLDAVQRVGLAMDTDGKRLAAQLAFDLGPASGNVAKHVVAPPPGWAAASANAPMAAQVNFDLRVAAALVQSCSGREKLADDDFAGGAPLDLVGQLDSFGIRAGRAFVHTLDPGEKEGTGAISLDLTHARFMRAQLDQIPGRSTFEKSRTFGIYKGRHISVPFVGSGDYVLDDTIAIAAMGDGVLAAIGSGASAGQPPLVAIDLRPPGMSAGVWEFLLAQLDMPNPKRFAQRLLTWSELHVGARLDRTSLVIEAAGTRR